MTPPDSGLISEWGVGIGRVRSGWRHLSPPQLFAASFAVLILFGTLGLRLLPGLYVGPRLGWLDSLFTAVSAVCVTGLIVVDTATYFTPAGQFFVLLLIQLGGLGMITFTSLIIVSLGKRLSLRQELLTPGTADVSPGVDVRTLVRDVVRFTFLIEALGAILLYGLLIPRLGPLGAVWPAIFHAVSAFCNAGFSTYTDSLIGFQLEPFTLLVVMALIVAGGLGFLTIEELHLKQRARRENKPYRISLHSRIVLGTTLVLLVFGWLAFTVLEWRVTLAELPPWARLVNGLFMSVTARTAGFATIDYMQATEGSNFLTIILMAIGGSPGSMAGGLKTTTVALIGLLAWSRFRGAEVVSFRGRSIPEETIQRAVGLFVFAFGIMTAAILILTTAEAGRVAHLEAGGVFLVQMFEAVSAFGTVGLSMGATPELSVIGKWTTILLMYIGRVGPLTFAAAIALKSRVAATDFRYAYEEVVVG